MFDIITTLRNAMCDILVDSIDASGNGKFKITDSGSSVLVTNAWGINPAYGAAGAVTAGLASFLSAPANGIATAGGGSPGTAVAYGFFTDGADAIKFKCTVGGPGSGQEVILSSDKIQTGQEVAVSRLDVLQPAA